MNVTHINTKIRNVHAARKCLDKIITVESPDKNIRAELALETSWVGNTVYPSAAILRIWYRNYKVIEDLLISIEGICYALEITGVDDSCGKTRLGTAHQKKIHIRELEGKQRGFDVILRLSDMSVFLDVQSQGHSTRSTLPVFAEVAPILSLPDQQPVVAYVGPGAIAAAWPNNGEYHLVLFNRPGQIAEMCFNVLSAPVAPVINRGADGSRLIYTQLPFCALPPSSAVYSDDIRHSYCRAFDRLLEHYAGGDDDFWIVRGDPGVFVVGARRIASKWIVCGLTHAARTLTTRFEELWLRLPPAMRSLQWRASIIRDPVLDEPGEVFEESFDQIAPDTRIALELKKNGGFIIEFDAMRDVEC